jgi:hypothetical protein
MNRDRFKLLSAAYHEAGHATVAIANGIEFNWIAVFRGGIARQPWSGKFSSDLTGHRYDTSHLAMVDIAGMISESRFTSIVQLGRSISFAGDAASQLADQIAAIPDKRDPKKKFVVPISFDRQTKPVRVSAFSLSGTDLRGFRSRTRLVKPGVILSKVMTLLDNQSQWDIVERIAEALVAEAASGFDERRELTSAEISLLRSPAR